ncbi:hypothetical protein DsansV1_C08g0085211 [Dioscorea sansibarensis]
MLFLTQCVENFDIRMVSGDLDFVPIMKVVLCPSWKVLLLLVLIQYVDKF